MSMLTLRVWVNIHREFESLLLGQFDTISPNIVGAFFCFYESPQLSGLSLGKKSGGSVSTAEAFPASFSKPVGQTHDLGLARVGPSAGPPEAIFVHRTRCSAEKNMRRRARGLGFLSTMDSL